MRHITVCTLFRQEHLLLLLWFFRELLFDDDLLLLNSRNQNLGQKSIWSSRILWSAQHKNIWFSSFSLDLTTAAMAGPGCLNTGFLTLDVFSSSSCFFWKGSSSSPSAFSLEFALFQQQIQLQLKEFIIKSSSWNENDDVIMLKNNSWLGQSSEAMKAGGGARAATSRKEHAGWKLF